jgi:hypothetical protein
MRYPTMPHLGITTIAAAIPILRITHLCDFPRHNDESHIHKRDYKWEGDLLFRWPSKHVPPSKARPLILMPGVLAGKITCPQTL